MWCWVHVVLGAGCMWEWCRVHVVLMVPRGGHIYFTKNGVAIGVAFSGVSAKQLWPTIGLGAEGEVRAQLADCWLTAG